MKTTPSKILILATIITIIGFIMDGDPKEPSMAMRFIEFFAMIAIVFISSSILYYGGAFAFKKFRKLSA